METLHLEQEKKEILKRYRALLRACRDKIKKGDRRLIRLAFDMALEAHKDMRRKTGEPYIYHPLAVAQIVAEEIGMRATSIIAALLHDVVEDTEITLEDIKQEFGKKVAHIIEGLTKISKVYNQVDSIQAENFRKILLTLAEDVRVILIKIADRLHNMRTMDAMPKHKQLKLASETLYLYAPLAHRLGLYSIKSELEDLSMKYLEPEAYQLISSKLQETETERNHYIREFIRPIKKRLREEGVKCKIFGRAKSIYSIWEKMHKKHVEFEEVYDIFAIRIIIDSKPEREKSDCWYVYSIVTDIYHPNPERLRDWISMPKSNGYEALHTTVMGPQGKWVEVQIRSERMNEIAEKGIAAHWKYKEGATDSALDEWLRKVREVLEDPQPSSIEFLDNIKLNLFAEEIFVFTPKGDLKVLPAGSTVLDFAFEIHTDIGYKCIGAKVNNQLVSLNHRLKSGDQVEIITSNVQQPIEEWLEFVTTAKAKAKIKDLLKQKRKKVIAKGRSILEEEFSKLGISVNTHNVYELQKLYGEPTEQDLFYAIGSKKVLLNELEQAKVYNGKIKFFRTKSTASYQEADAVIKQTLLQNANLLIFGSNGEDIAYDLAQCCKPIPGDEIVAITQGDNASGGIQQIAVHKTNCPKAIELMSKYGNRILKTKWVKNHELAFLTGLKVTGLDDVGVMYNITKVISGEMKINMQSITIEGKNGRFEGAIILYVHDTAQLNRLITRLKQVKGIQTVEKIEKV